MKKNEFIEKVVKIAEDECKKCKEKSIFCNLCPHQNGIGEDCDIWKVIHNFKQ